MNTPQIWPMSARVFALLFTAAWIAVAVAQPAAPAAVPPSPPASAPPSQTAIDALPAQPTMGDDRDTIQASEKWLALLDAGKPGTAWDAASPHLKSVVTRKQWIEGITAMRKPFGKLESRKGDKFARAHQLPGAPDGDYSIVEFVSKFKNGKQGSEQVIWMLTEGEVWRVSGYFIR